MTHKHAFATRSQCFYAFLFFFQILEDRDHTKLQQFFELYGRDEAAAMAIILATADVQQTPQVRKTLAVLLDIKQINSFAKTRARLQLPSMLVEYTCHYQCNDCLLL